MTLAEHIQAAIDSDPILEHQTLGEFIAEAIAEMMQRRRGNMDDHQRMDALEAEACAARQDTTALRSASVAATLAAATLRSLMGQLSQEIWYAGWLVGTGEGIWAWMQGRGNWMDEAERPLDPKVRACMLALADMSGVWWTDDGAVPLSDWIAQHGEVR